MGMEVKDAELCIRTCVDYFNYYSNETWIPLAVEKMFSAVIYEDDDLIVVMEGRIDLVAKAGEETIVIDHKSEGRKSKRSMLDNQFICYPFILGLDKVCQNVIGLQTSYSADKRFERILHPYTDNIKQEWYESTIYKAKEIADCSETEFFPRSYSSCNKWGGCPYKSICETTPDNRAWVIERDFVKSEFDLQKEAVDGEE
jgi:hypothetical protein